MKILITENKFKNMVTKLTGYDFSNHIEMITNWEELDNYEKNIIFGGNKNIIFNKYLNHYGPMFRFSNIEGVDYLVQKQEGEIWFIVETGTGFEIDYSDFLRSLNLYSLGISLIKIIDEFVEE